MSPEIPSGIKRMLGIQSETPSQDNVEALGLLEENTLNGIETINGLSPKDIQRQIKHADRIANERDRVQKAINSAGTQ